MSRTPSSLCPASPIHQDVVAENPDRLDDVDGLPVIHCDVQLRVQQIIVEHKVIIAPLLERWISRAIFLSLKMKTRLRDWICFPAVA